MENLASREINIDLAIMNCGGFNYLDGMKDSNSTIAKQMYYELSQTSSEENLFDSVVFQKQRKINDMKIKKLSGKNEANNAPKCPRCGNERYYLDEQRRAGDEIRNFDIVCPSCNLKVPA
jgi:DNA-directed RNA polymerase subunit M/transcription elongation factor TFIIS